VKMKCERGYNVVCILKSLHLLVFFVKEIKYFLDKKCFPHTIIWKTLYYFIPISHPCPFKCIYTWACCLM
jgi:hypothetical protein